MWFLQNRLASSSWTPLILHFSDFPQNWIYWRNLAWVNGGTWDLNSTYWLWSSVLLSLEPHWEYLFLDILRARGEYKPTKNLICLGTCSIFRHLRTITICRNSFAPWSWWYHWFCDFRKYTQTLFLSKTLKSTQQDLSTSWFTAKYERSYFS